MKKEKTKVKNKEATEKALNKTEVSIHQEENAQTIIEREIAKKKVPKQVSQEILKKIFKNLILAIVVMAYFITCNILYTRLNLDNMELITKAISCVFLIASIILFEFAYKRDSGTSTITAIELLILSIHALFIHHVITIYQLDYQTYILTSSYLFAIYYVLKSIIIYTKARIKYLKSLSDISEIVKEEPIIKEAKKRKNDEEETLEKDIENNQEEKPKSIRMRDKNKTKTGKEEKTSKKRKKKQIEEQEEVKQVPKEIKEDETIISEEKVEDKPKRKRITKNKKEEATEETKKKSATKKKVEEEKKEPKKRKTTKKKEEVKLEEKNENKQIEKIDVENEVESIENVKHQEEQVQEIEQEAVIIKPTKPKSKRGRKKKTVEK